MKSIYQLIIPIFIGCILYGNTSHAQVFGGHPASTRWNYWKQDTLSILYQPAMQKWAERIQQKIPQLQQSKYALGQQIRPITILLQNQTTQSNGYVGIGPWRSEFFTTPLQNSFALGSLAWQDQLLLHEARHIHQYANFNQGWTKLFRFLAGDYGQDFFNSMIIPNWFWEGDAVWQETEMSVQGRGRLPYFFGATRSLSAAQKNYRWQKLRNGSLRDFTPDHYQLGYQLTAFGYHQFGPDFWKKVTADALHLKGSFYPFQKAIQHHSGLTYKQFRTQALQYFQSDTPSSKSESATWAASKKHFQGDIHFPQWRNDSQVVYLKTSFDKVPQFIQWNALTSEETVIATQNIALDTYFSYRNGKIVYASLGYDKRWGWKDYGDLTILNLENGLTKNITHHGKYFSPDINLSGDKVIAVAVDSSGATALQWMDIQSGEILKTFPSIDAEVFTYPKFIDNDHVVIAVRKKDARMGLLQWEISTNKTNWLLSPSSHVIAFPYPYDNNLYFTASFKGKDEVLLMSIGSGAIYRATKMNEGNTGHYEAAGDYNKIAWVDQTAVGKKLRTIAFTQTSWENITDAYRKDSLQDFGLQLSKPLHSMATADTTAQEYAKTKGLFRIHSWLPNAADPEYSFSVYSENLLNNMQGEAGLVYNRNEGSTKFYGGATYAGWYPWIQLSVSKTLDRKGATKYNTFSFHETETKLGWSVPLNFSGGQSFRYLRIGSNLTYAQADYQGKYKDSFYQKGFTYSNAFIRFSNQGLRARKDIYPRFAQVVGLEASHAVTHLKGQQVLFNSQLFFPGLFQHHHLIFQMALQGRDTLRQIFYANNFPFSRGYLARNGKWMQKVGINYQMPIAYPDWGVGNIVYLLRIRQNLFYDHTRLRDTYNGIDYNKTYRSLGTEIFFDTKWWNQEPFSIGIRYSHLLDGAIQNRAASQWELILPILIK